jgi:hypothetical protein
MVHHTTSEECRFDSEEELKDWMEAKFESNGWDCIREVKPDYSDYRVDLLLLHEKFGPIGVEVKFLEPGDSAGVIADAHRQITEQYWDKKYFGERVLLWAVCIYEKWLHNDKEGGWRDSHVDARARFTREFFCRYGIGVLRLGRYAELDFNYSNTAHKIPCFPITHSPMATDYQDTDMESLKKSVANKRGVES